MIDLNKYYQNCREKLLKECGPVPAVIYTDGLVVAVAVPQQAPPDYDVYQLYAHLEEELKSAIRVLLVRELGEPLPVYAK